VLECLSAGWRSAIQRPGGGEGGHRPMPNRMVPGSLAHVLQQRGGCDAAPAFGRGRSLRVGGPGKIRKRGSSSGQQQ
jgi:hypothetical protein